MSIEHYTPKFLEAMERFKEAVSNGADSNSQLLHEMKELGWRERIRNLYRIKDKKTGQFVFFSPNSCQQEFEETKTGRDEILKCRQVGFSTWSCVYAYDRARFDEWSTGIMSHKREQTGLIFEIIKNVNEWFKRDWGHLCSAEQEQDSSSRISWKESKASITVSYDFRGLTVRFLHVSEASFIEAERLTNSLQSVPEDGEIILESTPQGCGGFFYNQWQNFKKNGDLAPFKGHFFPWFKHYPENKERWERIELRLNSHEQELKELHKLENYHLAWRRWKIEESCDSDEQIFEVEYPSDDISCFLSGQNQVFTNTALKLQESFVKPPSFVGRLDSEGAKKISFYNDKKGLIEVWEMPKAGVTYAIGVDIAEGVGKDYSVAIVLNKNTGEQVAMYRGFISPDLYAQEIWKLGYFYNYAWVCPEVNSFGLGVVSDLVKTNYSKIYKRTEQDDLASVKTKKFGFRTTGQTRPRLINDFVAACKEGNFRTKSLILLQEMSSFVQIASKTGKSVRMEARPECHDDTVIAGALAWHMAQEIRDVIMDRDLEMPNNFVIDEDTGFLVPTESFEGGFYAE